MRRITFWTWIALVGVVAFAYGLGVVTAWKKISPVPQVVGALESAEAFIHRAMKNERSYARWEFGRHFGRTKWVEKIHPDAFKTDVDAIIHVRGPLAVQNTRRQLQQFVWGMPSLPYDRFPDSVGRSIIDTRYNDIEHIKSIDKYVVEQELGINSIAYHFFPKTHNGKFVIYHQGHRGDFALGKPIISALLEQGYSVIAFAMPFFGMNSAPDFNLPQYGFIKNFGHNTFYLLESNERQPIRFFLEPITAVINYVQREFNADCFAMTGISGGGWTTILYAALDTRICRSYPVAGKLPLYLLALPPNDRNTNNRADLVVGDYEEFIPRLNSTANFLDLSVLGASGDGRKQIQFINKYDRLTYRGIVAKHYEDGVVRAVAETGNGAFQVVIDDTHTQHDISPFVRGIILEDLKQLP